MIMDYIGDVGVVDDITISLYQCSTCKTVKTNPWIDGQIVKCDICIGNKRKI